MEGYTKDSLENRVAEYYEHLYRETFPPRSAKRPVTVKDVYPMLVAFEHRLKGGGFSEALNDVNDIDIYLLTWGHFARLVDMRKRLDPDEGKSHLTEAERGQNLGRLGVTYLFMAHPKKTETVLSIAESIAKDCGDKESEGLWQIYRAWNSNDKGAKEEAEDLLKRASQNVQENEHKAFCAAKFGWVYQGLLGYHDVMQAKEMLASFDEAIRLYNKTPNIDRDLELRAYRANLAYIGRARSYSVLGQHDLAQPDFEEAFRELEAIDHQRMLAVWRTNQGSAEREMGKLAQAKKTLEQALRVSIAIGDRRGEQVAQSLLGKVYRDAAWARRIQAKEYDDQAVDRFQASAHYIEQAVRCEHKLGNRPRLAIALHRLAIIYRDLYRASENNDEKEEFLRLAKDKHDEAVKVAGEGGQKTNSRTMIYDWLERTRLSLAQLTSHTTKVDAKPIEFPRAVIAPTEQEKLIKCGRPAVVPPVELTMGIVLLRVNDAYKSDKHRPRSPYDAFRKAKELLDASLEKLNNDESHLVDSAKDKKRWAEINYAIGSALVGQAVSVGAAEQDDIEDQAIQQYEKVLSAYTSPGFVRDTYQDLVSIGEADGAAGLVDRCLELFRDKWHPEAL